MGVVVRGPPLATHGGVRLLLLTTVIMLYRNSEPALCIRAGDACTSPRADVTLIAEHTRLTVAGLQCNVRGLGSCLEHLPVDQIKVETGKLQLV